ncbi:MAG: hypothetical protein EOM25_13320 [Deltaproteobacteria bacterium]|nr:hypothetical protein [Deltaproteobacteria bacterium]
MNAAEKVQPLHGEQTDYKNAVQHDIIDSSRKDMGRIGLFVAILCVILLVVFFFGFSQNFSSLNHKVEALEAVQGQITQLGSRMDGLETSLSSLQNLPEKARKMVLTSQVQEISQKAAFLSTQVDQAQADKLKQAQALLNDVQKGLAAE